MGKKGRAQDNHTVKGKTGPTHTRTSQALFELLNTAFHAARANWETCCTELSVLHPASMLAEVMCNVKESVVMELLKNKVNFAFEKQSFEVFFPALSSRRVVGKTRQGSLRQMLAGMKPIDDLHCTGEIVGA